MLPAEPDADPLLGEEELVGEEDEEGEPLLLLVAGEDDEDGPASELPLLLLSDEAGLPADDEGLVPPGGGTTLLAGDGGCLMAEPNSAEGTPADAGGAGLAGVDATDAAVQLMRSPVGQVRLKLRSVMVSLRRLASYRAVPDDRLVTPGVLSTEAVCTVPGVVAPEELTACTICPSHLSIERIHQRS